VRISEDRRTIELMLPAAGGPAASAAWVVFSRPTGLSGSTSVAWNIGLPNWGAADTDAAYFSKAFDRTEVVKASLPVAERARRRSPKAVINDKRKIIFITQLNSQKAKECWYSSSMESIERMQDRKAVTPSVQRGGSVADGCSKPGNAGYIHMGRRQAKPDVEV
jgi:hypothetical protein